MAAAEPGTRTKAAFVTAVVIAAPGLAIIWLHRLGHQPWIRIDWSDPVGWLGQVPLEDAIVAVLRQVALLGAYWLLLSTLAYLLARLCGIARLIETTSVLTLPPIRRMADRVVAGTIAVSTLTAPVIGLTMDRPDGPVSRAEMPTPTTGETRPSLEPVIPGYLPPTRSATTSAQRPAPEDIAQTPQPGETPSAPIEPDGPADLTEEAVDAVVEPGDHLWDLAAKRLRAYLRRVPGDHEIAPYWARVVEANRNHLRSGDPDLIYPGEVVVLPPIEA